MRWQEALGFGIVAVILGGALYLTSHRSPDLQRWFVDAYMTTPRVQHLPAGERKAAATRVARQVWAVAYLTEAALAVGAVAVVWWATR